MKFFLLTSLLFIFHFSYSQENLTVNDSISWDSCEEGILDAKSDFNNGIYNASSYGFVAEITPKIEVGFNEFCKEYMLKKYSINIESKGCIISKYSECYTKTAQNLIFQKFGKDIFEKSRKEAMVLFRKE
ncbi:MAG: hypothetical protein IPH88_14475 [Bacteroidales bacterium]|nr:hypothetical protein [Bacteroidales bacterium]